MTGRKLCAKIIDKEFCGRGIVKLKNLLVGLSYKLIQGTEEISVNQVTNDTRELAAGDVFVCIKGFRTDGRIFIEEAVRKGARAVVAEEGEKTAQAITIIEVEDARYALAAMSAACYDYPARKLKVIGVTGTKGKTTTAWLLHSLLNASGIRAGLIGTIETDTGKRVYKDCNTTPKACKLQKYLKEMQEAGCRAAVMEVSSQGVKLRRTAGIFFEIGIFTNLGRDHIGEGEHSDFAEYLQCKRSLFKQCRYGVGNIDDGAWEEIFRDTGCERVTFGLSGRADVRARDIRLLEEAGRLGICFRAEGLLSCPVRLRMTGVFNVYNALAALTAAKLLGVSEKAAAKELRKVCVPGRMEQISCPDGSFVFVDYAHNAMSLESSLKALREYSFRRIVTVFGCGGERPRARREEMGFAAGIYSDFTIVTTDNPRSEPPEAIIEDIVSGLKRAGGKYLVIEDRRAAVAYAVAGRKKGDAVLIAGKGHEEYQERAGEFFAMDDRRLVREALREDG